MSLCPRTGVLCGRLDCDPAMRECAESRINPVPTQEIMQAVRAVKLTTRSRSETSVLMSGNTIYQRLSRPTPQESIRSDSDPAFARPRCMFDVYLSIERSISDLEDIVRQRTKHSAELKIRLDTLAQVKGRVQAMRRR